MMNDAMCYFLVALIPKLNFTWLSCGGLGVDTDTVWHDIQSPGAVRIVSISYMYIKHFTLSISLGIKLWLTKAISCHLVNLVNQCTNGSNQMLGLYGEYNL